MAANLVESQAFGWQLEMTLVYSRPYYVIHLSIVAGLVVRHGDLSHEMTLSHEGRRPECDNVNRV